MLLMRRSSRHDRPEGVRHRQHRHAGAPPDAAASVLVHNYWAFCRFSRNLVAPVFDALTSLSTVNLKTAKSLGLDLPLTLLARADEVIE
jgi:hypothetical protein